MKCTDDRPALDAVLVGLIACGDPAADAVDEEWLEVPRWRAVARALCAHRHAGGNLGDLQAAGAVVAAAPGIYLPHSAVAEAMVAAAEIPAAVAIRQGRERLWRLQLRRVASLLDAASYAEATARARVVDLARRALDEVVS